MGSRSLCASLLLLFAAGCSSGGGGDSGGSSSSSGASSGGNGGSDASNVDGTTGASSSGAGSSGSSSSGGGSSGASSSGGPSEAGSGGDSAPGDAGCLANFDAGPLSDGGPGAAAGGASGVLAYCTAGCDRAETCGIGQNDAGACASNCQTQANPVAQLERADYLSSLTSCIGSASCATITADGGFSSAVSTCATAAFVAIPQDTALTSLCQTISCLSCVSAQGRDFPTCLARYGNLSDETLLALNACLSSNFCSDPDAGASCERTALTPH